MIHSHDYKNNKYKDIGCYGSTLAENRKIVPHFIEVSTLGVVANISDFTKALKIPIIIIYNNNRFNVRFSVGRRHRGPPMMPDNLKRSIVIAALKSYFSIYCNRNNAAIDVT